MASLRSSCSRAHMDLWWLRSHTHIFVSASNRAWHFQIGFQNFGLSLPDWRNGGKFGFWSASVYSRPQTDIFGKFNIIQITLVLYFFGVLFSGIKTNPFLFILARFVTGLRLILNYAALEASLQLFLQQLMSLCRRAIVEELISV